MIKGNDKGIRRSEHIQWESEDKWVEDYIYEGER